MITVQQNDLIVTNLKQNDLIVTNLKQNEAQKIYLWWSLCTLYLHACQVRVTVGNSGLCCCTCVNAYFEH